MLRFQEYARKSGANSASIAPGATVTVYINNSTSLATVYDDNAYTAKANPFTADATSGLFYFYAQDGRYDVRISGTGVAAPYTWGDVWLGDYSADSLSVFNVKDYGALGDGTTDDTSAIASAITAAGTNNVVYFPAGTYITDGITVTSKTGLTFRGAGRGISTIKLITGGNADLLTMTSCDNLTIEKLTFDGNTANQSNTVWDGIVLKLCDGVILPQVAVQNVKDNGIRIMGCTFVHLSDIYTENCGNTGGNVGAGIQMVDSNGDGTGTITQYVTVDGHFSNADGLPAAAEGAGIQTQVKGDGTHLAKYVTINNFIALNPTKYGMKLQGRFHEINNAQVIGSGNAAFSIQGEDMNFNNIRCYGCKNRNIGIAISQTGKKNVNINNFTIEMTTVGTTAIYIANNDSASVTLSHVNVNNGVIIKPRTEGIRIRSQVSDININNVVIKDPYEYGVWASKDALFSAPTRVSLSNIHTIFDNSTATASVAYSLLVGDGWVNNCKATGAFPTAWSVDTDGAWNINSNLDYSAITTLSLAAPNANWKPTITMKGAVVVSNSTGPNTINGLTGGVVGHELHMIFNDAVTKIDFTNTTLKGNGAVDWTTSVGSSMVARFDGTNWHCVLSKAS